MALLFERKCGYNCSLGVRYDGITGQLLILLSVGDKAK